MPDQSGAHSLWSSACPFSVVTTIPFLVTYIHLCCLYLYVNIIRLLPLAVHPHNPSSLSSPVPVVTDKACPGLDWLDEGEYLCRRLLFCEIGCTRVCLLYNIEAPGWTQHAFLHSGDCVGCPCCCFSCCCCSGDPEGFQGGWPRTTTLGVVNIPVGLCRHPGHVNQEDTLPLPLFATL